MAEMSVSSNITVTPKIQSATQAKDFMVDFVKNPPSNPAEAVKKFGSAMNIGGAIQAGITAVFPLAGPILPILSGIFDLFGGGGPSIGEVTLDAIHDLSNQLSDGLKNLEEATQKMVDEAANKTIDLVLQGVDEIARQQSAVEIFEATNLQNILIAEAEAKATAYADFQTQIFQAQETAISDLQAMVTASQQEINNKYEQLLAQVYGMVADLAPALLDAFNQYLNLESQSADQPARSLPAESADMQPGISSPGGDSMLLPVLIGAGALVAIMATRKKIDKMKHIL